MDDFLFSGMRNNKVTSPEDYIAQHPQWRKQLETIMNILDKTPLTCKIKWGAPVYSLGKKNIVGMMGFKHHCGLWFFEGVLLSDPHNILVTAQDGKTKAMRHLKFSAGESVPTLTIQEYVEEAVALAEAGKSVKRSNTIEDLTIPIELQDALENDELLRSAFTSLTLSRKRDYAHHIASAKRQSTKTTRLQKIIPLIKAGKGLNDKYR